MLSAFLHLLLYSNVLQTIFYMKGNILNADQTSPKGSVKSGAVLFAIYAT